MPDRNRHGEAICDWSDLPVTGCAHCTGATLDIPADQTPAHHRPAKPGVVVRLDTYRGLPYYAPSRVATPASGVICRCGRPAGDAFMCPQCVDDLDRCLGDMPALAEDLDVAAQRLARVAITSRAPSHKRDPESILDGWPGFGADTDPDTTVTTSLVVRDVTRRMAAILARTRPDAPQAVSAQDSLHAALVGAVRALCGSVGQTYNGPDDTIGLSRWLLRNLAAIPLHPEGPDITAEIVRAHDRALKVIDNTAELVRYGRCGTEGCDAELLVPAGVEVWQCPGCGGVHSVAGLDQWRQDLAADQCGTVGELVGWARIIGVQTTRNRINWWITSGQMSRRGATVDGATYRLGDVLDLEARRRSTAS